MESTNILESFGFIQGSLLFGEIMNDAVLLLWEKISNLIDEKIAKIHENQTKLYRELK